MKYLFLDIDGVRNSFQAAHMFNRIRENNAQSKYSEWMPYEDFCPLAFSNLLNIIEEVEDLNVVISSTWRIGCETVEELKAIFDPIGPLAKPLQDRIIGRTPIHRDGPRGAEIFKWLEDKAYNPDLDTVVILDDDSDMEPLMDNLVQTNARNGLIFTDAERVIWRFNKPEEIA